MGYYIRYALGAAVDGLAAFLLCFRPGKAEPPPPRPESIDRYFSRVGGYLVNARNRFGREYIMSGRKDERR